MLNPVLTLLVASSLHAGDARELRALALEIVQSAETAPSGPVEVEAALTVRDIPFHFDDFRPAGRPPVIPFVTYDWRSPVIFDLP